MSCDEYGKPNGYRRIGGDMEFEEGLIESIDRDEAHEINESDSEIVKEDDDESAGIIKEYNRLIKDKGENLDKCTSVQDKSNNSIKTIITHVLKGGSIFDLIGVDKFIGLVKQFIDVSSKEKLCGTMSSFDNNIIVVGDIHGSLESLNQVLFDIDNFNFIFLGDYVDRGPQQLECLFIVYLLKLYRPNNVILLRGNHEACPFDCSEFINEDIPKKMNGKDYEVIEYVQKLVYQSFDYLSLFAVINNKCFCVHGGIPSNFNVVKHLAGMNKPFKFKYESVDEDEEQVLELLWNDPCNMESEFKYNEDRGGFKLFNEVAVQKFFKEFDLNRIIRGHQFFPISVTFNFPEVMTVFSAYNYVGQGNAGAFLILEKTNGHIIFFLKEGNKFTKFLVK